MKKMFLALPLALFFCFAFTMSIAYAADNVPILRPDGIKIKPNVTKTPSRVQNVTVATTTLAKTKTWVHPVPKNSWSGNKKVWAQVPKKNGKLAWVSFQNAPPRSLKKTEAKIKKGIPVCSATQDVNFSVAWRTDKTSHPGEKDVKYGHVGIRCYGNLEQQCPPTQGEAWQNIVKLINNSMPEIPKNWEPNMVYGPWLSSCN